jgi:hypothetical protein
VESTAFSGRFPGELLLLSVPPGAFPLRSGSGAVSASMNRLKAELM